MLRKLEINTIVKYVKLRSDMDSDATAFKLSSSYNIRSYCGDHHPEHGGDHEAQCNPLLLFGYAQ